MNAHRFMGSLHDPDDPRPRPRYVEPLAPPPAGDIVIFEVWTDWMFLWSATTPLSMRQTVETAPFRYIREHEAAWQESRDFTVDVFHVGGEFTEPAGGNAAGGSGIHLWLTRIENLKLGPVYASAGFGGSATSAGEFVTPVEREISMVTPRGMLAVETGTDVVHGQLRATHEASSVPDGYATIDSRITAAIGWVAARSKLLVEGAVARTSLHVPGAMTTRAATGGVSLSAAHRLSKHLQATVLVDVARSFYAPAVTTLDFAPRWGAQFLGAIQATVGR
jgi:hypothetical protein